MSQKSVVALAKEDSVQESVTRVFDLLDAVHLQMHQQNLTMVMMDVWAACHADI